MRAGRQASPGLIGADDGPDQGTAAAEDAHRNGGPRTVAAIGQARRCPARRAKGAANEGALSSLPAAGSSRPADLDAVH